MPRHNLKCQSITEDTLTVLSPPEYVSNYFQKSINREINPSTINAMVQDGVDVEGLTAVLSDSAWNEYHQNTIDMFLDYLNGKVVRTECEKHCLSELLRLIE